MKQICHWLCLLFVAVSCTADRNAELDKVIAHYRDSVPDEEKLYAALFLRDNMDAHYSMESEAAKVFRREADSLFTCNGKMGVGECRKAYDSLLLKYRDNETELVEYSDVEHLKAEFLIAHIDSLFRVWREDPWVEDYDLEHFCNYVLPYRVGKEPVSDWYGQYRAISQKRMEGYTNVQRNRTHKLAVLEAVRGNLRQENYFPSTYVPELPLTVLPTMRLGSCEEYAVYCTALLRAYGLPAAVDFTPQWGNRSMGHSWTVYLPASGEVLPFASDDPIDEHFYRRQTEYMPKVFRHTFAKQPDMVALQQLSDDCPELFRTLCLLDVTDSYVATSDVDVHLFPGVHDEVVYLAVFDNQHWSIVHYAKRRGLRALFPKMGRNIVYLPVTYNSSQGISPAGHPFVLDAEGCVYPLLADTARREEVTLHRKYKCSPTLDTWAGRLRDAEFQVATSSDYSDAMPIIKTGDALATKFNSYITDYEGDYRYLRFVSPHSWSEVAEMELYGDSGKVMVPIHSGGHNVKDMARCFDGDPLSFSGNRRAGGARLEMEFAQPIHIDSLRLLPRNDDNFIREGEQYELYYWDGRRFASIARMEGNREGVLYVDNVPTNALLLLRNHTKGKEERIFTYENGEQVWW